MSILKNAFLAAAMIAAGASSASAADYEFKLHHFLGEKAPAHTQMLVPWAKQVEENSGGKVHIEIYPAMTLGGRPPELINQVRDGVVDLVWTVNGYTPGLFPRTEVFELPGIHTNDPAATNQALMDLYETDLKDEYKGVEVISCMCMPARPFTCATRKFTPRQTSPARRSVSRPVPVPG